MITNINKASIVLASNCRNNTLVFKQVKNLIKKKYPNLNNLKIAIIYTAQMGYRNKKRSILFNNTKKMTKKWQYEKRLGLPLEYIDCSRKHNLNKFKKYIKESKIIWVTGGDTLYLLYHLKKSGFFNILRNRILNDDIIFVGCCAGAIIAGKSILPVFIDRASRNKHKYYLKNTYKSTFWHKKKNIKGMNLINKLDILPHCNHNNNNRVFTHRNNTIYCLPEKKQLIL